MNRFVLLLLLLGLFSTVTTAPAFANLGEAPPPVEKVKPLKKRSKFKAKKAKKRRRIQQQKTNKEQTVATLLHVGVFALLVGGLSIFIVGFLMGTLGTLAIWAAIILFAGLALALLAYLNSTDYPSLKTLSFIGIGSYILGAAALVVLGFLFATSLMWIIGFAIAGIALALLVLLFITPFKKKKK